MNTLQIRPSRPEDAPEIEAIFAYARTTIAALGIDQWQNGSGPNAEIIREDITAGLSHVVDDGGKPAAVCSLIDDGEPTYDVIVEGSWLTDRPYLAIHRFAVGKDYRGQGLPALLFAHAARVARQKGLTSLRIDTHHGNVVMRRTLEKNGFTPCGTIFLANGDRRIAYEKPL